MSDSSGGSIRLDKWLWFARFGKTRATAQKLIERGQVRLNGAIIHKASCQVREGDKIAVVMGSHRRTVIVRGLGARRGSPPEARLLYDEPTPPEELTWEEAAQPLRKPG